MKRRVFLSYAGVDRDVARQFVAAGFGETEYAVWTDQADFAAGDVFSKNVKEPLRQASAMVVLVSKDSLNSPWVQFEVGAALAMAKPIIPILVGKSDVRLSLPDWLQELGCVDARGKSSNEVSAEVGQLLALHHEGANLEKTPSLAPPPEARSEQVQPRNYTARADRLPLIVPRLLDADFARLNEELQSVETAGADWIHIDIMDGTFTPHITFGPVVVEAVRRSTRLPLNVHLLVANPDRYIEEFAKAGASLITVPIEATADLRRTAALVRSLGLGIGVSLNPATPTETIDILLPELDLVLLLAVTPGLGGQSLQPQILSKIVDLRFRIDQAGLSVHLAVGGGVSAANSAMLRKAGADVFITGSTILSGLDFRDVRRKLMEAA